MAWAPSSVFRKWGRAQGPIGNLKIKSVCFCSLVETWVASGTHALWPSFPESCFGLYWEPERPPLPCISVLYDEANGARHGCKEEHSEKDKKSLIKKLEPRWGDG